MHQLNRNKFIKKAIVENKVKDKKSIRMKS